MKNMNPEGTFIKIISWLNIGCKTAYAWLGLRTQTRANTDTHFTYVHLCMHVTFFPWSVQDTCVYACKNSVQIYLCLHTCASIDHWCTVTHTGAQYSWGTCRWHSTGMHLITSACPCAEGCVYHTHSMQRTCAHWLYAYEHSYFEGEGRVMFLGIIFLEMSRNTSWWLPTLLCYCLLRYLRSFCLSWLPKYQKLLEHIGTCTCQPLLLRLEFSWDGLECFLSLSSEWFLDYSWWGGKEERFSAFDTEEGELHA